MVGDRCGAGNGLEVLGVVNFTETIFPSGSRLENLVFVLRPQITTPSPSGSFLYFACRSRLHRSAGTVGFQIEGSDSCTDIFSATQYWKNPTLSFVSEPDLADSEIRI